MSTPVLTVIVPVFNESSSVDAVLREVLAAPYDKQILVVNDGSTDDTRRVLDDWRSDPSIRILCHEVNRGKGAAIRTAVSHAIGRFTIIQDGDLELHPSDYPALIEPLLADEADFAIGSRFLKKVNSPRALHWGVSLLNLVLRLLYGIRLSDEACGYKALSTQFLRQMDLQCERFEFCPEVVAKASRMQLRIREVPVEYHPRSVAEGKKLRYRDGFQALLTLWRWRNWSPPISSPGVESTDCPDDASREDEYRAVRTASASTQAAT